MDLRQSAEQSALHNGCQPPLFGIQTMLRPCARRLPQPCLHDMLACAMPQQAAARPCRDTPAVCFGCRAAAHARQSLAGVVSGADSRSACRRSLPSMAGVPCIRNPAGFG
jgi:hypothetical protein